MLLAALPLLGGCDLGGPHPSDTQSVKVLFKYGFRDQVDTFNGTLTKDLILNGTTTVAFSFTSAQQDSVIRALERSDFFHLPDTLFPVPGVAISPNPGVQVLRVQCEGRTKTLVWNDVLDASDPRTEKVLRLWGALEGIVRSTDTYRSLPPASGGYD